MGENRHSSSPQQHKVPGMAPAMLYSVVLGTGCPGRSKWLTEMGLAGYEPFIPCMGGSRCLEGSCNALLMLSGRAKQYI